MKINYWEVALIALAILGVFLFGRSCGISSVIKQTKIDTTIKKDSVKNVYVPVAYKVDSFIYSAYAVHDTLPVKHDTLPELAIDTAAILQRYYETAYYSDTQILKRGIAIINDTLTQNRIKGRSLSVNFRDTTLTKTIVLTQPKKPVLYFGVSLLGNKTNAGIGADLSFKATNDKIYSIGTDYWRGQFIYKANYKIPIRRKK